MLSANWALDIVFRPFAGKVDLNFCETLFAVAKVVAGGEDHVGRIGHAENAISRVLFALLACRHAAQRLANCFQHFLPKLFCLFALLTVVVIQKAGAAKENGGDHS